MAFPLTIEGSLSVPRAHDPSFSKKSAVEFLAEIFENDRWTYYDVNGNEISFRNKKALVNVWSNPFGAANHGTINISIRNGDMFINYKLSMKFILFLSLALSMFVMVPSLLNATNVTNLDRIMITTLAWVWLFGGCYVFTRYKFRRYLKNIFIGAT